MAEYTIPFYEDLYTGHLSSINGIQFTRREIDVIACLLNARGTSKIASFLSIALRTVMTHMRNIMRKIDCNSRENIIDFFERSDAVGFLREYYASLVTEVAFKKTLKEISKVKHHQVPNGLLIYWRAQTLKHAFLHHLPLHLNQIGVHIEIYDHFPNTNRKQITGSSTIFLIEKKEHQEIPSEFVDCEAIDLSEAKNYYAAAFEVLKKLMANANFEHVLVNFWDQVRGIQNISVNNVEKTNEEKTPLDHSESKTSLLISRRGILGIMLFLGFLVMGLMVLRIDFSQFHTYRKERSIRSDLIIPTDGFLLHRPELIAQIDKKLESQKGIRTIALIGMGGSGKTVLARQYAYQQKAYIIWELNAETLETLQTSFFQLAQALTYTEEDKKILTDIKETDNANDRDEKILQFVKNRLKLLSSWLLIYDNAEHVIDIKRYFPQDRKTWGEGTIIVTTRNSNVQNNNHVKEALFIGDLTLKEKLSLFSSIMSGGTPTSFTAQQISEAQEFLGNIPSFPLDVSVAAYYLKNMNPSYEGYIRNLKKTTKGFDAILETLLKEVGGYTNTRYHIVTLSLQQLVKAHKDFRDLLFFISFLDSQNIPREILNLYKGDTVIDAFIAYLKKYSLIINDPTHSIMNALSIHRSTRSICHHFFLQEEDPMHTQKLLNEWVSVLEKAAEKYISTENLPALKNLTLHCEALLKHDTLLSPLIRGRIKAELGSMYGVLSNMQKQKQMLNEALIDLEKANHKANPFYARALSYKGIYLWEIGEFKEAEEALKKSLSIYQITTPEDKTRIARSLIVLGTMYRQTARAQEALKVAKKVFSYLTEDKHETALAFELLGTVHAYLGQYTKAEEAYKRGLAICQAYNSLDYKTGAALLGALGELYRHCELYEEAKKCHKQALEICQKLLPEKSRFVARTLRNMGRVYNSMGDFKKGLYYSQKSVNTYISLFGKNNIKTQWAYCDLGKSYLGLGDLKTAKQIFEKCLTSYEKDANRNAYWIGATLTYLGRLYLAAGDVEKGEELLQRGIEMFKNQQDGCRVYISLEKAAGIYEKRALELEQKRDFSGSLIFRNKAKHFLEQALHYIKLRFPDNARPALRVQNKLQKLQKNKTSL